MFLVVSVVTLLFPLCATFFETQGLDTGGVHSKRVLRRLSLPLLWYPGNCFPSPHPPILLVVLRTP